MTQIRFHIGAHKTATTHLQMTLDHCEFSPRTRHVRLKRLRQFLISPVRKQRFHLPWHRWYAGTWLFSDENILGTTEQSLLMYPDPARALRYFCDCDLSLYLCVRQYDSFLASAYGERLWRHAWQPFPNAIPVRRWPDLVEDLQRDLPGVPVRIWCYEDYREHAQAIMQYYTGGRITSFGSALPSDPKSGFSNRAVKEMARFSKRRPSKAEVVAIRKQYPVSEAFPRFDPWTQDQRDEMRAMYQQDLEIMDTMAERWQP